MNCAELSFSSHSVRSTQHICIISIHLKDDSSKAARTLTLCVWLLLHISHVTQKIIKHQEWHSKPSRALYSRDPTASSYAIWPTVTHKRQTTYAQPTLHIQSHTYVFKHMLTHTHTRAHTLSFPILIRLQWAAWWQPLGMLEERLICELSSSAFALSQSKRAER